MRISYKTKGICARAIYIDVENGIVENVSFEGGCNGNTSGLAALVKGMKVDEVIEKLKGIKCGFKDTSCPAQLAEALKNL
ncbi:MAG: TIGR03905 family TSCPD domain-containing protein [Acutalibacteraceae bacterium]|jgi:uncharacterized protein (TIGR03905 family)